MKVKTNYIELDSIGDEILGKSQTVANIIEKLLAYNSEMSNYWFGNDASVFINNQEAYLKKIWKISNNLKNFSDILKANSRGYMRECDCFETETKKEVAKYEQC